jgi:hypothetical protein
MFRLANENNLNFVDSFDGVLSQNVRNIVIGGSNAFHVIGHVEVEIFTSWVLNFEGLEVRIVVLGFYWNSSISFPLPWNILMDAFLITLGHKWRLLSSGFGHLLRLFKVDPDFCVVGLPVNVDVERVVWVWVKNLVHAH